MKSIFAINLGSTSTKIAYYEDDVCVCRDSISYSSDELKQFSSVFEQKELRQRNILDYMAEHQISLDALDAFVTRGGQTEPIVGGVYEINKAMVEQAMSGDTVSMYALWAPVSLTIWCEDAKPGLSR